MTMRRASSGTASRAGRDVNVGTLFFTMDLQGNAEQPRRKATAARGGSETCCGRPGISPTIRRVVHVNMWTSSAKLGGIDLECRAEPAHRLGAAHAHHGGALQHVPAQREAQDLARDETCARRHVRRILRQRRDRRHHLGHEHRTHPPRRGGVRDRRPNQRHERVIGFPAVDEVRHECGPPPRRRQRREVGQLKDRSGDATASFDRSAGICLLPR